ncbi:MAG: antibiotic biosynthesis monooxygenase [Pseudomonadales bacterium]|nr:antibiotic biosynthesis monooxygenase [Pseudomonadales bacterium]
MAIIIAGKLTIKPGARDAFVEKSREPMQLARNNEDCKDFAVSPDPIDLDRVNIFEKWSSRSALDAFRSAGPESDMFSLVDSFDVTEYEVSE